MAIILLPLPSSVVRVLTRQSHPTAPAAAADQRVRSAQSPGSRASSHSALAKLCRARGWSPARCLGWPAAPLLRATLPEAQAVLNRGLPTFYAWLADDLHVTQVPSTPSHAIEWVEDFLLERRSIPELVTMHQRLSAPVVEQSIPYFIALFDDLVFGRADWQRAAALLCLVLLAPRSSQ